MTPRTRARTGAAALLTTLGLGAALLLGAAPAHAHDALTSTAPAADETITANPGKVTLTLSNKPLQTETLKTSVIKVTAPDGHTVSTGDITVEGNTIAVAADIDHPGKHTVDWRTVSADGHPIEGSYTFTYTGPAETAAAAAAAAGSSQTPAPSAQTTPASAEQPAAAPANDTTGLLIAAGVLILALIGAVIYLARRNRPKGDQPQRK